MVQAAAGCAWLTHGAGTHCVRSGTGKLLAFVSSRAGLGALAVCVFL